MKAMPLFVRAGAFRAKLTRPREGEYFISDEMLTRLSFGNTRVGVLYDDDMILLRANITHYGSLTSWRDFATIDAGRARQARLAAMMLITSRRELGTGLRLPGRIIRHDGAA